ncbi:MAG: RimK family alpha-L-glutamate ligase [Planctomycetales bacterium]|nr:RimK family alpha-L-glutamate ligase [Planctomycetales bacterium]
MQLAVLCDPESWYFRDLARAGQRSGDRITSLAFSDLTAVADGPRLVVPALDGFDGVLVRTMPPGSLEQVVFRMDCLAQLAEQGVPVLNRPRAIEIAVDKFLSTALLARHGVPTPRTICCQTADQAMDAYVQLGSDVVIKPLFGGEGRGITRVNDEAIMLRVAKTLAQLDSVLYLQEFVAHEGADIRVLRIGETFHAIRRRNPHDWRTNVSRGATAEPITLDAELLELARRSAEIVSADIAGVDVLESRDGRRLVLEVNAVPGWKALAQTLNVDIAAETLEFIRSCGREMMERAGNAPSDCQAPGLG